VIFADFQRGSTVRACLESTPGELTEMMKEANLRGRGGAGFPAGLKWEFCRKANAEKRYVVCNADEGEPGTFKDRVLLTERAPMLIEGMTTAAYCAGAVEGIIYLRHEYRYLVKHLEDVLAGYRADNLLGDTILGSDFSFDIRIQLGAGAYVCGEESALIESAEGKRGEPRNRPPYPVQVGYRGLPTAVNNVETLCAAARIVLEGATWYRTMGTAQSVGTKVLSVSGDCAHPGIYELEWGASINELLKLVGGEGAQAVQVGGASGTCVSPEQFDRTLGDNDLATGGSIIVIGPKRDLLSVVSNFVDFFTDESCGVCVPCRVGNLILRRKLDKILSGHGVESDLNDIVDLGAIMKSSSRCGLGQTAANPLVTTIQNFKPLYMKRIKSGADYDTEFDLASAVKESCEYAGRTPKL
jgi:[NiFe] hydrogenase diaphorase moiety large subunit